MKLLDWMKKLPIMGRIEEVINTVLNNDVTIITSGTGTGKTVIIPQFLADNFGRVVVTQPRVINSISIANTVKQSYNDTGYHTGIESMNKDASLLYATDFSVANMISSGKYPDVLVIDEFHERNIAIELLITLYKNKRLPFRLVIMSATMDTTELSKYFYDAPVIDIAGNTHSIEELVIPANEWYQTMEKEYNDGKTIILFEPGKKEIEKSIYELSARMGSARIVPWHSEADTPREILADDLPKVIVATNSIETGVTIGGDVVVFDSQKHRVPYNINGITELRLVEISQFSAKQRRGRSGRTSDGKYYGMRPITDLVPNDSPDIERLELADSYLYFKLYNMNMGKINLLANISTDRINGAISLLQYLDFLDNDGNVTRDGRRARYFSSSVREAKTLMVAKELGVENNVAIALAVLLTNPLEYKSTDGVDTIQMAIKEYFALRRDIKSKKKSKGKGKKYTEDRLLFNKHAYRSIRYNLKRYGKQGLYLEKPYDYTKHNETVIALQYIMTLFTHYGNGITGDNVFNNTPFVIARECSIPPRARGLYLGTGFHYNGRNYYKHVAKLPNSEEEKLLNNFEVIGKSVKVNDGEVVIDITYRLPNGERFTMPKRVDFNNTPTELITDVNKKLKSIEWKNSQYSTMPSSIVDTEPMYMEQEFGKSPIDGTPFYCYIYTKYTTDGLIAMVTLDKDVAEKEVEISLKALNGDVDVEESVTDKYIDSNGYPDGYPIRDDRVYRYGVDGNDVITDYIYLRKKYRRTVTTISGTDMVISDTTELIAVDLPYSIHHTTDKYPYASREEAEKVIEERLAKEREEEAKKADIERREKFRKVLPFYRKLQEVGVSYKYGRTICIYEKARLDETPVEEYDPNKHTTDISVVANHADMVAVKMLGKLPNGKYLLLGCDTWYTEYYYVVLDEYIKVEVKKEVAEKPKDKVSALSLAFEDRW